MSAAIAPPPRQASIYPAWAVLAVGAVLPYLLHGGFQLRLATLVWIYAILCMGFNLLYGYADRFRSASKRSSPSAPTLSLCFRSRRIGQRRQRLLRAS